MMMIIVVVLSYNIIIIVVIIIYLGFDELRCHCGTSVIYPPVPCGTHPPECYKPCTRTHSCNHEGEKF